MLGTQAEQNYSHQVRAAATLALLGDKDPQPAQPGRDKQD